MKKTMTRQAKVKVAFAGVAATMLMLSGCGSLSNHVEKKTEPYKDAKRSENCEPKDWTVNRAPDGFSNTATACMLTDTNGGCGRSGIRVTVMYKDDDTTRGAVDTVADPNC